MNCNNIHKKKYSKKLIKNVVVYLSIFILIMSFSFKVNASVNNNYDYLFVSFSEPGLPLPIFNLEDSNGNIHKAYCVDEPVPIYNSHRYSRINLEDSTFFSVEAAEKIRSIVQNSYPFQSLEYMQEKFNMPTLTKLDAITAIELAIWKFSNNKELIPGIPDEATALYYKLIDLPAIKRKTEGSNITMKEPKVIYNDETKQSDLYLEFKADEKNSDNSNIELSYDIQGKYDNVADYGINNDGYKSIKLANIDEGANYNITVWGSQNIGINAYLYYPEGGRYASQTLVGADSSEINISNTFNIETVKLKSITISKTDIDDEKIFLKGAEFTIYDSEGQVIKVLTTGDDGKILTKLPPGKYIIEETKAPDGYTIDNKNYLLEVKDNDNNIEINFTNKKNEIVDEGADDNINDSTNNGSNDNIDKDNPEIDNSENDTENESNSGEIQNKLPETGVEKFSGVIAILLLISGFILVKKKI